MKYLEQVYQEPEGNAHEEIQEFIGNIFCLFTPQNGELHRHITRWFQAYILSRPSLLYTEDEVPARTPYIVSITPTYDLVCVYV